jgi:hypothetical protein
MLKTASNYINSIGALVFQGTWDALTNTPTLTSSVGNKGDYYVVGVAGNTNLNGITDWQLGDYAVFNGAVWQKVDNTDAVISVNGQQGVVNLSAVDVGATPNTAYVIAGNNLDGGGQLTGNVTIDLNSLPAANVTGLGTMAFQNANSVMITGGYATGLTNVETDKVTFDLTAGISTTVGELAWANDDRLKTLVFGMDNDDVQYIGQEQYFRIKASSAITKGQVIMFSGTLGASGGLQGAPATGLQPDQSNYILGIAKDTLNTNDWGNVQFFGEVKGVNTTGGAENWVQGDVLYYNPAVTGGLTKNKPTTPNAIAIVAAVVYVNSSNGILFVRPTYGSVLGGTDGNVQFGTLAGNDFVVYNSTNQRWENYSNVASRTALGLGTIATQNANNVAITGGTLANVIITSSTVNSSNINTPAISGGTYANANITSVAATFPNNYLTNSSATIGTTVVSLGATVTTLDGVTLANATVSSGNATFNNVSASNVTITTNLNANLTTNANATFATSSLPLVPEGYLIININGSAKKIPYYGV